MFIGYAEISRCFQNVLNLVFVSSSENMQVYIESESVFKWSVHTKQEGI